LVEELAQERDASRAPLFQVEFVLQNAPMPELQLGGLTLSPVELEVNNTKFDVTLIMEETAEGLRGWMQYSTDLFDQTTIDRLIRHYRTLLLAAVADPGQRVSELPLLTEEERRESLVEWNRTEVDYEGAAAPLQILFERQVERTPEAVALECEGEQLTYAELNRRADRLARLLRGKGVGPDSVVGLLVERSAGMVVSLLAVLKAGGAYLPLDVQHPAERLRFMLEDASASLLLTQEHLRDSLHEYGLEVVCVDSPSEDSESSVLDEAARGVAEVSPENLAYVIYTSGSTGRPKGVGVPHRAIVNRLLWMQRELPLTSKDRLLHKTPISFDASVWEIFSPLLAGAQLVMARPGGHQDPAYLARTLAEQRITVCQLVPSMLQVLLQEPSMARCDSLRRVYCGGEVLPYDLQERFFSVLGAELHNLYGPTEATIDAAHWTCERESPRSLVPIGGPLGNVRLYVLDRRMQVVPLGVPGELYVGGAGVARGYLGRADLTAERFVPDPFSTEPGARLYRTGDLTRRLPGGELEYLGRIDQQVKIRGFRIELGEVESALSEHPRVRQCVVAARGEAGDKRLVGYLVPEAGETPGIDELREHLSKRLPEYMLPTSFVLLEELPLLVNGKVDRKALPAPDSAALSGARVYVAPRTPTEELLAGIWSEVLGVERVGAEDNFFDLGGHSLLATQVVTRVREALGVELPMRSMFESPTVGGLASSVEQLRLEGQGVNLPPLMRVERAENLPLSYTQQRLWFLDQLTPGTPLYNVPAAIRLDGHLNITALENSLAEIVRRHEVLRTTFKTGGAGQPVQLIHPPRHEALLVVDLSELPDPERRMQARQLALDEARRPFDLSKGPLMRTTLVRLSEDEHIALFTMHHIVSDAWSTGVLVKEVVRLYESFVAGEASTLPELPVQYADFAAWQREHLAGEALELHLEYWRRQFAVQPAPLELPTDYERPQAQSFRGASRPVNLSRATLERLRELSRREGVTLFMTLLAAYKTLLHRYTGQDDIAVGSPIANRSRAELEGLIGCFINTLALRTDLSGGPSFRDLLGRVRETTLGAYAHQDLPFELLVGDLQPERRGNFTPLFQVWFALQNTPGGALRLPGVNISNYDVDTGVAQFDLALALAETGDGIEGLLTYNSDIFEDATAAEMVEHFAALLEAIAADPDRKLFDIPLGAEEPAKAFGDETQWLDEELAEDQFVI
jgi:amino acid adenylation domain-containing protein